MIITDPASVSRQLIGASHKPFVRKANRVLGRDNEFRLDMRRAPQRVLARHISDQIAKLSVDLRPSHLAREGLPSPIEPESLAVPAHNRVGLDDEQRESPTCPQPRELYPEDPIIPLEPWRFRFLLENGELLPKGEVRDSELRSVTKDAAQQQQQDANHAISQPPELPSTA